MGRTERGLFVAGSIAFLLGLGAVCGVAAPVTSDAPSERSSTLVSASPAVFADRVVAAHRDAAADDPGRSLRNAIELMVLAAVCGVGVAVYSATADRGHGPDAPTGSLRR
jgi:hypothetical protein